MQTFLKYVESRQVTSLVEALGDLLDQNKIHPVQFVQEEMPAEMINEFWNLFGGRKGGDPLHARYPTPRPPSTPPGSRTSPPRAMSIDFDGAMQGILRVIQQIEAKGMNNRVLHFTSGSQAGQKIPLVTWLQDMVNKLKTLNSKFYAPATPYSQQAPPEAPGGGDPNPRGANSYATRHEIGAGMGLRRGGKGGTTYPGF